MQPFALHFRVLHVALHGEHFRQGIRYRGPGGGNQGRIFAKRILEPAHFRKQVERLAGAFGITQAAYPLFLGRKKQILELVQFVDKEAIDAQFIEIHHVIAAAHQVLNRFQLGFQVGLDLFHIPDDIAVAALGLHVLDGVGNLGNLLVDEAGFDFRGKLDLFNGGMAHNHGVVIAGRDFGE